MTDPLNKKYYKISDVALITGLHPSILRFWETQFKQLRPKRNDKGTRFYTPRDIETVKVIKYLLKDRGLKIAAARGQLASNLQATYNVALAVDRLQNIRSRLVDMIDSLKYLPKTKL